MKQKRVAIVGAGPAGTSMALQLVGLGVDPDDLVIMDKARFPRPKLCGGGITFRGTELLSRLTGRPALGGETVGLEFRSEVGRFDVFEKGPQWLYDRGVLDSALLDACREKGVEIREEVTITGIEAGVDGWRIARGSGAAEAFPWVIGADGANGVCRRASGLRGGITGRLVEAVFERTHADVKRDVLYFDFDPILDGIPGYAWVFPYPKPDAGELWKIGVMDGRGTASGEQLRRWTLEYAERLGFRLLDAKVAGWPERYYDSDVEAHRPGLMLIGEAWGIDALLGEGIAPAMFIAEYAARRLREALDAGSSSVRGFERGFLRTEEGKNLWFQARLADRLYGAHPHRWLRVLFGMEHMKALAGAGNDAYGRLFKHIPSLLGRYSLQILRTGLPSAAPIRRALPDGAGPSV